MPENNNTTVSFAFHLDQKVRTPFGEQGLVSMLAYDESGKVYFVKTRSTSNWFKESQLQPDHQG